MRKRRTYNPKRRLQSDCDVKELAMLAETVRYGGNPEHKRNPGDFGLSPSVRPRADKTLCDTAGVFTRAEAVELLKQGVKRGLISEQIRGPYPQNIWAVTAQGQPLEAQLENEEKGIYHGYPMPQGDPLREHVLLRWNSK